MYNLMEDIANHFQGLLAIQSPTQHSQRVELLHTAAFIVAMKNLNETIQNTPNINATLAELNMIVATAAEDYRRFRAG